jgi:hypothetical protein
MKYKYNFDEDSWNQKSIDKSIWHFDPNIKDERDGTYKVPVKFSSDWEADIEKARKLLLEAEDKGDDIKFWNTLGYKSISVPDTTRRLDINSFPKFKSVVEALGIVQSDEYPILMKLINQKPGQYMPFHMDTFKTYGSDNSTSFVDKVVRFSVALTDWNFGQLWFFGNAVWTQWKVGDCVHWHSTMAHGTVNIGHSERLFLQITGIPSDKTMQIIENNTGETIEIL